MNVVKKYIKSIFEFADSRELAIKTLRSLSFPFSIHVCKIFLWGSQNENWAKDWSDEIWNYLYQISEIRLKPSKKSPKDQFFKEYFFFPYLESADEMDTLLASVENTFQSKEKYPKVNFVNPENAYSQYLKFMNIILIKIHNRTLTYDFVINACREYLIHKEIERTP